LIVKRGNDLLDAIGIDAGGILARHVDLNPASNSSKQGADRYVVVGAAGIPGANENGKDPLAGRKPARGAIYRRQRASAEVGCISGSIVREDRYGGGGGWARGELNWERPWLLCQGRDDDYDFGIWSRPRYLESGPTLTNGNRPRHAGNPEVPFRVRV